MRIKFVFWPKISSQAVDFPVKLNFSHIKCNCRPRYLIADPSCSSDLTEPIILKFTKFSVIGPGLKFRRNWTLPHSVRSQPPRTTFSTFELPRFRSEVKQVRWGWTTKAQKLLKTEKTFVAEKNSTFAEKKSSWKRNRRSCVTLKHTHARICCSHILAYTHTDSSSNVLSSSLSHTLARTRNTVTEGLFNTEHLIMQWNQRCSHFFNFLGEEESNRCLAS